MANNKSIHLPTNPNGDLLTAEKLRSFSGCEHYSDGQAIAVIESLSRLAHIIVQSCHSSSSRIANKQALLSITQNPILNKAA